MTEELTITVHADHWMSSNDRDHRQLRAAKTAAVRQQAAWAAKAARLPRYDLVHVCAFIQYPTARRADPPNAWPTLKAALDGLTDAGVWADDDSTHVIGTEFRRDPGRTTVPGTYRIRLVLTDQAIPFSNEAEAPAERSGVKSA